MFFSHHVIVWQTDLMTLAFVTGGSRGLGLATARGLRAQGIQVVLIASDAQLLRNVSTEIGAKFAIVDLRDLEATRAVAEELLNEHGVPDILVLAHGVMSDKSSKTLRTNTEEWRRVLTINLDSVFVLLNSIVPSMFALRKGRVVVFSACLGRMSGPGNTGGLAPYRISKSGVNALVRNLAHETGLGSRGLLIDAICPNHCRTDMGGENAPRSADEGAETAIWLATREFIVETDHTGLLWEDRTVIPW